MGNHLKEAGIDTSMGSKGSPLDNAVAESFFATFKKDLINRRSWPQKAETRSAIFEWIEVFYNRQRIHTTLGNYAPEEFETLNLKVVGSNPTRPIAFQSGSRLPAGAAQDPDIASCTPDTTPPDTTITKYPKAKTRKKQATFEFTSTEPGSFECSLDGAPFASCTSPDTLKVKKGKHSFAVRAKDAVGNVDPTPATFNWKVKKKKKKRLRRF